MEKIFPLSIMAADKVFYSGPAVSFTIPAMDGLLQILADHENMIIATVEGTAVFKMPDENNTVVRVAIGKGYVSISNSEVLMLVDYAEYPEDIPRVQAEAELARAQEQLRQDASIQEYNVSRAALARAMVRLSNVGPDIN